MEKWNIDNVIKAVRPVNVELARVLEKMNLGKEYYAYYAEYNYGDDISDDHNFYFPFQNKLVIFEDLPLEIQHDFKRWKSAIPLGIVLDKTMEHYINRTDRTIPARFFRAGDCFGYDFRMGNIEHVIALPLYSVMAGARSTFCMASLGNNKLFSPLKKYLNRTTTSPKNLYEQHTFFKELYKAFYPENPWKLKLLYFPDNFMVSVQENPEFQPLANYLLQQYWQVGEITRARTTHDYLSSEVFSNMKKYKPTPEPCITEAIRSFILIMINACFAYRPLINDAYLPLDTIQNILLNEYKIEHRPIIFGPDTSKNSSTLYYLLNYPSSMLFSRSYARDASTIKVLDLLHRMTKDFFDEMLSQRYAEKSRNTFIISQIKSTQIQHFHTHTHEDYKQILSIDNLKEFDFRFNHCATHLDLNASSEATRGLIGLKKHEEKT